jgi:hypothetical protein
MPKKVERDAPRPIKWAASGGIARSSSVDSVPLWTPRWDDEVPHQVDVFASDGVPDDKRNVPFLRRMPSADSAAPRWKPRWSDEEEVSIKADVIASKEVPDDERRVPFLRRVPSVEEMRIQEEMPYLRAPAARSPPQVSRRTRLAEDDGAGVGAGVGLADSREDKMELGREARGIEQSNGGGNLLVQFVTPQRGDSSMAMPASSSAVHSVPLLAEAPRQHRNHAASREAQHETAWDFMRPDVSQLSPGQAMHGESPNLPADVWLAEGSPSLPANAWLAEDHGDMASGNISPSSKNVQYTVEGTKLSSGMAFDYEEESDEEEEDAVLVDLHYEASMAADSPGRRMSHRKRRSTLLRGIYRDDMGISPPKAPKSVADDSSTPGRNVVRVQLPLLSTPATPAMTTTSVPLMQLPHSGQGRRRLRVNGGLPEQVVARGHSQAEWDFEARDTPRSIDGMVVDVTIAAALSGSAEQSLEGTPRNAD